MKTRIRDFPEFRDGCKEIYQLVEAGILGPEEFPEDDGDGGVAYWHWKVKKPNELPKWLKEIWEEYNEIRW